MSDSLWPHGLQQTRHPCTSLSLGVCSNSYPLRQWCYLTIWSSTTFFSFCLQSPSNPRDSQASFPAPQLEGISSSVLSLLYGSIFTSIDDHWKTIALTRWTLVGNVMSLLLNILFRLVITVLPRSKRLLISWLQSPSAVILEPPKIKSDTVSTVSPSISHEFNSDDHYIYYCRQESLRRNGVAIMVNKRVWTAVLGCNLKNDRMISVRFQGKPLKYHSQ